METIDVENGGTCMVCHDKWSNVCRY